MKEVIIDFSLHGSIKVPTNNGTVEEVFENFGDISDEEFVQAVTNDGHGIDELGLVLDTVFGDLDSEGNLPVRYSLADEIIKHHTKSRDQIIAELMGLTDEYQEFLELFEDEATVSKHEALTIQLNKLKERLHYLD